MQLALRNWSRVSAGRTLAKTTHRRAQRWLGGTENFLGDDDLTRREMGSRRGAARKKSVSFPLACGYLNARNGPMPRKGDGTVPRTCGNSCESWRIARRGSRFRETTLDENDGVLVIHMQYAWKKICARQSTIQRQQTRCEIHARVDAETGAGGACPSLGEHPRVVFRSRRNVRK